MFRYTLLFMLALAANAAVVSLTPAPASPNVGDQFALRVEIAGVTDLYTASFTIGFDPGQLQFLSESEGGFLGAGGPTLFIPGSVSPGVISNSAVTLLGNTPGVTGAGTLAELRFKALSPGLAAINLVDLMLLDSSVSGIESNSAGASVRIGGAPEPGAAALIAAGLAALVFLRRIARVA